MKTQTVILVGVIVGGALVGYYLWSKRELKTNTTTVSVPIGSGGVTASIPTGVLGSALGTVASGLLSDLGGLFSGASGTQTVTSPVGTSTNLGTIAGGTAYSDTTSGTGLATGTWDDFNF
jgi:hypothetical protein